MDVSDSFGIGELARRAGVGIDAVRFYERRGVLPRATRRASGYRTFTAAAVERIRLAKSLQSLGFSIAEIAALAASIDRGAADCASERHRVDTVLARVDEQLAALRSVRRRLAQTRSHCRAGTCELLPRTTTRR